MKEEVSKSVYFLIQQVEESHIHGWKVQVSTHSIPSIWFEGVLGFSLCQYIENIIRIINKSFQIYREEHIKRGVIRTVF